MASLKDILLMGYYFIRAAIFIFSLATACFDVYVIIEAFKWRDDFAEISGPSSGNQSWAVAILVLSFLSVISNLYMALRNSHRDKEDEEEKKLSHGCIIVMVGIGSVVNLATIVPPWEAVRRNHWADLLRTNGHADHAYHVDTYYHFMTAVVIFWSVIAGISFIVGCFIKRPRLSYEIAQAHHANIQHQMTHGHLTELQTLPDIARGEDRIVSHDHGHVNQVD